MPTARRLGQVGLLLAALVGPVRAWASQPSAPSGATAVAAARASLQRIDHRLTQHRVEVRRLQRDIARQQARSQQASARLREQDRQIAELQRQLQAQHGGTPAQRGAKVPQP